MIKQPWQLPLFVKYNIEAFLYNKMNRAELTRLEMPLPVAARRSNEQSGRKLRREERSA
jgi:hypothetical protein